MHKATPANRCRAWIAGAVITASIGLSGCQTDIAGQTLPSPYYLSDDVQYYAPGPEFKLAREAAALKADREAYKSQGQPCCP